MPARKDVDRAQILARKAREDATAVREFAANPHISDAIIGFHAQQAVEKWLKTVLLSRHVSFEWKHDIDYLIELLEGDGLELPTDVDSLIALTVYAVPMRYEELLDTEPLERKATVALVDALGSWAEAELRDS